MIENNPGGGERAFHVHWRLLSCCGQGCPSCSATSAIGDRDILVSERLLPIARQICDLGRERYNITLSGGDLLVHPGLHPLLKFMLNELPQAFITLETCAEPGFTPFLAYAQNGLQRRLGYNFIWHPGRHVITNLVTAAAVCIENGFQSHITLVDAPGFNVTEVESALRKASAKIPFTLNTVARCPLLRPGRETVASVRVPAVFCVAGASFLSIHPDGSYAGAPCGAAATPYPLWNEPAGRIARMPQIIHCAAGGCADIELMPVFEKESDAHSWLNDIKKRHSKLIPAQTSLLKQILVSGGSLPQAFAGDLPFLNDKQLEEWKSITRTFEDTESVNLFVNLLTSSGASLSSDYETKILDIEWDAQAPDHFESYAHPPVKLQLDDATFAYLRSIPYVLNAWRSDIEARFTVETGQWFEFLHWLAICYPFYRTKLELEDEGRLMVSVTAPSPACEQEFGFNLSIIVKPTNPVSFQRLLARLSLENLESVEIVAIVETEIGAMAETASLCREEFHLDITLMPLMEGTSYVEAIQLALQVARGAFTLLMDSSRLPIHGRLSALVKFVLDSDADCIICDNVKSAALDLSVDASVWSLQDYLAAHPDLMEVLPHPYCQICATSTLEDTVNRLAVAGQCLPGTIAIESIISSRFLKIVSGNIYGSLELYEDIEDGFSRLLKFLSYLDICFMKGFLTHAEKDKCALKVYERLKKGIFNELNTACKANNLEDLLTSSQLTILGKSKAVLTEIMMDYARLGNFRAGGLRVPVLDDPGRQYGVDAEILTAEPFGQAACPGTPAPILSVIMANYNKIAFLEDAVASILSQEMTDFELVIVDDASTDGSYEKLKSFALFSRKIRLFRMNRRALPGVARNMGVDLARGEYIIFVDSDDLCKRGYFSLAVDEMRIHNADMVLFGSESLDAGGRICHVDKACESECGTVQSREAILSYFNGRLEPAPWAKIFRTSLIRQARCRFDAGVFHQDGAFFFATLRASQKIVRRGEVVYSYRRAEDSVMRPLVVNYLHFHSSYQFYVTLGAMLEEAYGGVLPPNINSTHLAKWNIDNVLVPNIRATLAIGLAAPLTDSDYRNLGACEVFLRALLESCASIGQLPENDSETNEPGAKPLSDNPLICLLVDNGGNEAVRIRDSLESVLGAPVELAIFGQMGSWDGLQPKIEAENISRAESVDSVQAEYVFCPCPGANPVPSQIIRGAGILANNPDIDLIRFTLGPYEGAEGLVLRRDGHDLAASHFASDMESAFLTRKKALSGINLNGEGFPFAANDAATLRMCAKINLAVEVFIKRADFRGSSENLPSEPRLLAKVWRDLCLLDKMFATGELADFDDLRATAIKYALRRRIIPLVRRIRCDHGWQSTYDTLVKECPGEFLTVAAMKEVLSLYGEIAGGRHQKNAPHNTALALIKPGETVGANKLTVILYARNCEAALDSAIDRIMSIPGSKTIILVEDCSDKDATLQACIAACSKKHCLTLFKTSCHAGHLAAFQLVAPHIQSEWMAFFDAGAPHFPQALILPDRNPEADLFLPFWRDDTKGETESALLRSASPQTALRIAAKYQCLAPNGMIVKAPLLNRIAPAWMWNGLLTAMLLINSKTCFYQVDAPCPPQFGQSERGTFSYAEVVEYFYEFLTDFTVKNAAVLGEMLRVSLNGQDVRNFLGSVLENGSSLKEKLMAEPHIAAAILSNIPDTVDWE